MFSYRAVLSYGFSIISQTALISRFEKMLYAFGHFVCDQVAKPHPRRLIPLFKVNRPDTRYPASVTLRDLERLAGRHRDTYGRDTNRRHPSLVGLDISHEGPGGSLFVRMHEYCHGRVFSANIVPGCAKPGRNRTYTRSILTSSISKIRVLWAGMPSSFIEP